jgi:hypothetical protein
MADSGAVRARRSRQHAQGNHELCRPSSACKRSSLRVASVGDVPAGLVGAVLAELADADATVRELALRLAQIAETSPGMAGVQATKALAELVAAQREVP